jgi:hypothetical protein
MYSAVIEHHVSALIKQGLFRHDYPILVLVRGFEVLVKVGPEEGIEIYSDYSLRTKDFAIMHSGKTLEGFGTDFGVVELMDVLKALGHALHTDNLVIDHTNGPGVPLSRDRFREICQNTSSRWSRGLGEAPRRIDHYPGAKPYWVTNSPFLNLKRTLDQWFAAKG